MNAGLYSSHFYWKNLIGWHMQHSISSSVWLFETRHDHISFTVCLYICSLWCKSGGCWLRFFFFIKRMLLCDHHFATSKPSVGYCMFWQSSIVMNDALSYFEVKGSCPTVNHLKIIYIFWSGVVVCVCDLLLRHKCLAVELAFLSSGHEL